VVITIVDIIGGLIIGMVVKGMDISGAANRYILLTVGDGLVSQIPALLISTATGIIVTRTAASQKFSDDVVKQLGVAPQVLFIAGGAIFLMGFLPGFPILLNMLVGAILAGIGYLMTMSIRRSKEQKEEAGKVKAPQEQQITINDIVNVDPMNLEIGYNLIPLVDKEQGGDLLDRIKLIRRRIGLDLGILVPRIRIIDNVGIDASEYVVKVRGTEIASGKIMVNRLLAMNPKKDLNDIEGIEVKEPAFNLAAKWITSEERPRAESLGFDIFDPPSVVATHLTEVIRKNAHELITRQDVQNMLEALRKEYPAVIDEVLKISGGVGEIQKVLQNLLKEEISIRNMLLILETIADYGGAVKNIDLLTEYVRQALSKQIATKYADDSNTLKGIVIDPDLERVLADSITTRRRDTSRPWTRKSFTGSSNSPEPLSRTRSRRAFSLRSSVRRRSAVSCAKFWKDRSRRYRCSPIRRYPRRFLSIRWE
jgi:flagellar biosynthesis protein FlhA